MDGSLSASCDPDHSRVKIRDFRAQLYVSQITICCDGWTKTVEWDFCVRTFQEAEDATSLTGRSQGWLEGAPFVSSATEYVTIVWRSSVTVITVDDLLCYISRKSHERWGGSSHMGSQECAVECAPSQAMAHCPSAGAG